MQNYAKIGDIDHYSLHNIFIYNIFLQYINNLFLYLEILVKPELSMLVQWDIKIFHLFLN